MRKLSRLTTIVSCRGLQLNWDHRQWLQRPSSVEGAGELNHAEIEAEE